MNISKPLVLASVAALMACGRSPEATVNAALDIPRTVSETIITSGTPVTTADLSISGMTCQMMCGTAIRKTLAAMPGVVKAEVNFVEGAETEHCFVTYDEARVSDAQMIEAVQKLHGGQYKVEAVNVNRQKRGAGATEEEKGGTQASTEVSASLPALLPGVFELLARLVQR